MLCHCLRWESSVYVCDCGEGGTSHTHTHARKCLTQCHGNERSFGPDSFSLSLIVGKWVSDVTAQLITSGRTQPRHVLPNHIKETRADVGR